MGYIGSIETNRRARRTGRKTEIVFAAIERTKEATKDYATATTGTGTGRKRKKTRSHYCYYYYYYYYSDH